MVCQCETFTWACMHVCWSPIYYMQCKLTVSHTLVALTLMKCIVRNSGKAWHHTCRRVYLNDLQVVVVRLGTRHAVCSWVHLSLCVSVYLLLLTAHVCAFGAWWPCTGFRLFIKYVYCTHTARMSVSVNCMREYVCVWVCCCCARLPLLHYICWIRIYTYIDSEICTMFCKHSSFGAHVPLNRENLRVDQISPI